MKTKKAVEVMAKFAIGFITTAAVLDLVTEINRRRKEKIVTEVQ